MWLLLVQALLVWRLLFGSSNWPVMPRISFVLGWWKREVRLAHTYYPVPVYNLTV